MVTAQATYHPLTPLGDTPGEDALEREARLAKREKRFQLVVYVNAVIFLLSALSWLRPSQFRLSDVQCAKQISPYSPIWDAVEFWEGDFINFFNHTSVYRGPPNLERETAWVRLWEHPAVGIDTAGIVALNKSRPGIEFAQIQDSDPNNPTYAATLEVFHQLHCLNVVRKATWPLHMFRETWGEYYPAEMENPLANRMHVDHCIEALRLSLMCYGDVTPVLAEVNENRKVGLMLDFNVHHKCRDYSKIVQHVEQHGVDVPPLPEIS